MRMNMETFDGALDFRYFLNFFSRELIFGIVGDVSLITDLISKTWT